MNNGIRRSFFSFFGSQDAKIGNMTTLKPNDPAPYFEGLDEKGQTIKLADFKGKKLVLFFYPADNTPTCTAVACNLRDGYAELKEKGYELLGVSPDSGKKHTNFISKYTFPFSLISDPDQKIMNAYGVWGPKKFMGREFDGVLRTTFVIDEGGKILKVIDKVDSKNHTEQIVG